jgi:hypothetical protein
MKMSQKIKCVFKDYLEMNSIDDLMKIDYDNDVFLTGCDSKCDGYNKDCKGYMSTKKALENAERRK